MTDRDRSVTPHANPDLPEAPGLPKAQGLYDPRFEHDSCGVGFVVDMKGRKSNAILNQALTAVCCLNHRGAAGAEADTGDGAGITIQTPDAFFRAVVPFDLPAPEDRTAPRPGRTRRAFGSCCRHRHRYRLRRRPRRHG